MVGLPVVRSAKDLKILTHSRRSTEAMLTLSFTAFLHQVRSKGLGISLLKDESTCYWSSDLTSSITHALPDDRRLKQSIDGFMKSLCVTEVRQGRSSKKLSNNETHQWFSARRFRLTSSVVWGNLSSSSRNSTWCASCATDWTAADHITCNTVGCTTRNDCPPTVRGLLAPEWPPRTYRLFHWFPHKLLPPLSWCLTRWWCIRSIFC